MTKKTIKYVYVIKRRFKYLCCFLYKQDYDYRYKSDISAFASIALWGNKDDPGMIEIAKLYDGKIKKIKVVLY